MHKQSHYIKKIFHGKTIIVAIFVSLVQCLSFNTSAQLRQVYIDANEDNDLRKISFYDHSHGYVAFRDWIGYTADSGRTFVRKYITLSNVNFNGYTVNVTFGFGIKGVKAFNQDTIIAYGDYGLVPSILYSTDGGNNFKLVFHSQYNPNALSTGITDMVFPQNGSIGWAIDADRFIKTTDKGLTWTTYSLDPGRFYNYIEAVDNNLVFFISDTRVWRTPNGGTSWNILSVPVAGTINYAQFITSTKGWINIETANGGMLYYTSNNGSSWTAKTDLGIEPFSCIKMKFRNDSVGYAVVEDYYYTYKTSDSGKVWERIPRDNNFSYLYYNHEDIHFQTDSQFWVGGDYGLLELTTNAGGTTLPSARFKIDTINVYATNSVKLLNYSKPGYQYSWYLNNSLIATTYNASYTHDIYQAHDTIKLIITNGIYSDTTIKIQDFNAVPYPPPVVSSFTPSTGGTGTVVTITGNFFVSVTGVSFGGIPASSYTVLSINQISAIVGPGANGNVSVTTVKGTGSLPWYIYYPPPIINSFSPLSGPVGTLVTIAGLNFNSIPGNNIVYFGGIKANVQSATTTQLTVTVPPGAGYAPISVTVNNHSGYSAAWFKVTFPSTCGFSEYTFAPRRVFALTDGSTYNEGSTAICDFDGDGKNDVASTTTYGFSVVRNTGGTGNIDFATQQYYYTGPAATGLATGDLDGDGQSDLVVTSLNSDTVSIFKNTSSSGAISFAPKINLRTADGPARVILCDLDIDGKPDMIIINSGPNVRTISVFRNISINGNINFMPKQDFTVGLFAKNIVAGDLDGDAKPDLLIVDDGIFNSGVYSFSVYRNTSSIGTISFAPIQVFLHFTFSSQDGGLFDADGDGKLDVGIVYDATYSVGQPPSTAIYRNTSTPGNISLAPPVAFAGCLYTRWVTFGDLDGDNKQDIFGACPFYNNIKLFKNTTSAGNISMTSVNAPVIIIPGGRVSIGDIDGDGKADLVVTGNNSGGVNVYRNILHEHGAWAGNDTTICGGQTITLGRLPVVLPADGHTYLWTSNPAGFTSSIANPVVSPVVNTSYYLAITDPMGCTAYDTIKVLVGIAPTGVDAGPDKIICSGSTVQIGTPATGSNTYSWSSNPAGYTSALANPIVNPITTTSYILAVNSGTCIAKDTVFVTVNQYPVADAGPDRIVCPSNGSQIGIAGSGFNVYNWTSNPPGYTSTTPNPIVFPSVTTMYYLTVTLNECSSYDTVLVTVLQGTPVPTISASGPLSFCTGGSVILTSSATSNNQWFVNGALIPGATGQSLAVTQSGIYYVKTTDGTCNAFSANTTVSVNPIPTTPTITAGSSISFCDGDSVVLTSSASSGNQWYKDGIVITGAINKTYTAKQAGSYTVKVTVGGCPSSASSAIVITISSIPGTPTITAGGAVSFCVGGNVILTSSAASGNQWYKDGIAISSATNQTYSASLSGSYTVNVTAAGCTSSSSVSNAIIVTASSSPATPTITAGGSISFCNGNNVLLTSSATSGNQWFKDGIVISGETNQAYSATQSGSYTVKVIVAGCTSLASNAIIVTAIALPDTASVTAGGPVSFCNGGNVILNSSATSGNQWYKDGIAIGGATNQTYSATQSGSYSVKVIVSGCSSLASSATIVTVNPVPATPVITQSGNNLVSSAASGNQWYLNNTIIAGATGTTYTPNISGLFTVIVTLNGCVSNVSTQFNYIITGINSPNLDPFIRITPNPTTDQVIIKYSGTIGKFMISVSDLSGKKLFSSDVFTSTYNLSLGNYSSGPYIIRVINTRTGESIYRMVIKQ